MKTGKYVVLWHEINDSGVPRHVMGMSPTFDTRDDAHRWIRSTVGEDQARHGESGRTSAFAEYSAGDGVWCTDGNGQKTFYLIDRIEWEDKAADAIGEVGKILDGTRGFHGHAVYGTLTASSSPEDRVDKALLYIKNSEKEWLPLREWAVDVRFSPVTCVHRVMARTGEEARQAVNDMIDSRTLELTDEQKAEMTNSLLENVESVEFVGPEDGR